jgi:hypothetical protein
VPRVRAGWLDQLVVATIDPHRTTEDFETLIPRDDDLRHPEGSGDADGKRRRRRHGHEN